jgi:hypothetical protein
MDVTRLDSGRDQTDDLDPIPTTAELAAALDITDRRGGWKGGGWGLATSAVVALFPAAAIGAVAGHVSKGMNRGDLKELGERLDAGEFGLIVVAAADVSAKVEQAIANAQAMTQKDLQALEDELDADAKAAEEEQSS